MTPWFACDELSMHALIYISLSDLIIFDSILSVSMVLKFELNYLR